MLVHVIWKEAYLNWLLLSVWIGWVALICLLHSTEDMGPQWERSLAEDTITDLTAN